MPSQPNSNKVNPIPTKEVNPIPTKSTRFRQSPLSQPDSNKGRVNPIPTNKSTRLQLIISSFFKLCTFRLALTALTRLSTPPSSAARPPVSSLATRRWTTSSASPVELPHTEGERLLPLSLPPRSPSALPRDQFPSPAVRGRPCRRRQRRLAALPWRWPQSHCQR